MGAPFQESLPSITRRRGYATVPLPSLGGSNRTFRLRIARPQYSEAAHVLLRQPRARLVLRSPTPGSAVESRGSPHTGGTLGTDRSSCCDSGILSVASET